MITKKNMNISYASEYLDDNKISEKNRQLFKWMITKLEEIGYSDIDLLEFTSMEQINDLLIKLKPNSKNLLLNYRYIFGGYIQWCSEKEYIHNEKLYQSIKNIDINKIWKIIKPQIPVKFINNIQYKQILDSIDKYEELNSLYYLTFFQALYEGIYGRNFYEFSEIRASDINNNILTLRHEDNTITELEISEDLANNLIELSEISDWDKYYRHGICTFKLSGKYEDSCFKTIMYQKNMDNIDYNENKSRKEFYYHRMRRIYTEHIGFKLSPKDIFHAGIINRIINEMQKNNLDVKQYLSSDKRNREVVNIFTNELKRVNCNLSPVYFKNQIINYIDIILDKTDL